MCTLASEIDMLGVESLGERTEGKATARDDPSKAKVGAMAVRVVCGRKFCEIEE